MPPGPPAPPAPPAAPAPPTSSAPRTVPVLRGARWAAALGLPALAVLTLYLARTLPWSTDLHPWPIVLGILLGLVAWALGRRSWNNTRPVGRLALGLAVCGPLATAASLAVTWWQALQDTGFSLAPLLTGAATCLALAALLGLSLTLQQRRSTLDPDTDPSQDPASWTPRRPTPATGAGALAVAALLAASTVLPPAALARADQVTVAPLSPLPTPTSVSGEVAWSLELGAEVLDVVPGAAGPVVAVEGGDDGDTVQGLDPTDGSTTWSYRLPRASLVLLADNPYPYVVPSPDGAHVLLVLDAPEHQFGGEDSDMAVILDTTTGEVTGTHPWDDDDVQLTDHVALIDGDAVSLTDGSVAWTLPEEPSGLDGSSPFGTGPAGHSTLVLASSCAGDAVGYSASCTLTLADDADPTVTRTLDGVAGDRRGWGVIVNGWTIRHADGGWDETADRNGWPSSYHLGSEMEAVDLDSVMQAASGAVPGADGALPSDVSTVALGEFSVPSTVNRSVLALLPATDYPDADGEWQDTWGLSEPPAVVVDPATSTVVDVADAVPDPIWGTNPAAFVWPTLDAGLRTGDFSDVVDGQETTYLSLVRPDGTDPVQVTVDPAVLGGGSRLGDPEAQAAPGVVVVWATVSGGASQGSHGVTHTVLYGVS